MAAFRLEGFTCLCAAKGCKDTAFIACWQQFQVYHLNHEIVFKMMRLFPEQKGFWAFSRYTFEWLVKVHSG
jgi:hypothetical protein